MDHMKDYWPEEIKDMRLAIQESRFDLTDHVENKRMSEREITVADVACAVMTGNIFEGYDVGRYKNYRNPDPFRTVIGKNLKGEYITVGVALLSDNSYTVTTTYHGIPTRLETFFD